MIRLPWIEPLLVSTIHIPATLAWALLSGISNPIEATAWQLVAWPLLACACLATISPALLVLERLVGFPSAPRTLLWFAGFTLAGGASYLFVAVDHPPPEFAAAWTLGLAAAYAFHAALSKNYPEATS